MLELSSPRLCANANHYHMSEPKPLITIKAQPNTAILEYSGTYHGRRIKPQWPRKVALIPVLCTPLQLVTNLNNA